MRILTPQERSSLRWAISLLRVDKWRFVSALLLASLGIGSSIALGATGLLRVLPRCPLFWFFPLPLHRCASSVSHAHSCVTFNALSPIESLLREWITFVCTSMTKLRRQI